MTMSTGTALALVSAVQRAAAKPQFILTMRWAGSARPPSAAVRRNSAWIKLMDLLRLADLSALALSLICASSAGTALAQSDPPKVHQEFVDKFGVERKTGRFALPVPPQITIGTGDDALTGSFGYVDGSDFQRNVPAWLRTNLTVRDAGNGKYFDYYTVEFNGTSDTFRRETGTSGPFLSEYPSGATFVQSGGVSIYTDKFADQVVFGNPTIINYPDGRQTRFYGSTRAAALSFEQISPGGTVANNFGYMLKDAYDSAYRLQAVNLSRDYCDPGATSLCSVSQLRQSSIAVSGSSRILTNAAGGVATYRFDRINALDRQPYCTSYSDSNTFNGPFCDTPTSADFWYPVGITPPGATQETYSITYFKRALTQDRRQDPTHDDVFVASVSANNLTAQYTTSKRYYGSYGSNPYNLSFWLDTSAQLNGQNYGSSEANRPNPEWGSSRRSLVWTKNGLNQQTYYTFNSLVEPSNVTYPDGNSEQLAFDDRYNVTQRIITAKPNSGQTQIVTNYTYTKVCNTQNQAFCNKPLTIVDPLGGQTDYAYNSMGQIVSEIQPASISGSVRSRKVFSYAMRTAYIKDSAGSSIAAGPPISMLVRTVDCSTATPCTGTSDETVTDYDYGSSSGLNNLTLRSIVVTAKNASGYLQVRRTCYSYNYFGERTSESKPLGSGGGCS